MAFLRTPPVPTRGIAAVRLRDRSKALGEALSGHWLKTGGARLRRIGLMDVEETVATNGAAAGQCARHVFAC